MRGEARGRGFDAVGCLLRLPQRKLLACLEEVVIRTEADERCDFLYKEHAFLHIYMYIYRESLYIFVEGLGAVSVLNVSVPAVFS